MMEDKEYEQLKKVVSPFHGTGDAGNIPGVSRCFSG